MPTERMTPESFLAELDAKRIERGKRIMAETTRYKRQISEGTCPLCGSAWPQIRCAAEVRCEGSAPQRCVRVAKNGADFCGHHLAVSKRGGRVIRFGVGDGEDVMSSSSEFPGTMNTSDHPLVPTARARLEQVLCELGVNTAALPVRQAIDSLEDAARKEERWRAGSRARAPDQPRISTR